MTILFINYSSIKNKKGKKKFKNINSYIYIYHITSYEADANYRY